MKDLIITGNSAVKDPKYGKDGSLDENAQGVLMAGRIAKGMNVGCIHCHAKAKGNDFFYSNDQ